MKVAPGVWLEVRVTSEQLSVVVGAVHVAVWSQVSLTTPVETV